MIERDTVSKKSAKTGRKLSKLDGHIQFKDVCFSYPSRPDVAIFNNLNLDIPAGKIVALVGGSGSGKSTVVSLIERFYEPLSGHILLDKNDIRELDLKWLRQQIGLVNQEPALFATSIKENILYGKDDATLEELKRAVKLSDAQSFINNLPERLDTQVNLFDLCTFSDFDFVSSLLFSLLKHLKKGETKSLFFRLVREGYNYQVDRSKGLQYLVQL
jgi:ATP-binding cassette subfamily B (MDR/TAP) protein 1